MFAGYRGYFPEILKYNVANFSMQYFHIYSMMMMKPANKVR